MEIVSIAGEKYYKIENHDSMRPFFMSIVSDSNHWLFISSNGGITAGRKNAEFALFPYYTDDKITEFADITGSKSIFQIQFNNKVMVWEPFTDRFNENYSLTRNLYKNFYGNKIIFEEVHNDLNLTYRYAWNTSNLFGFVKKSEIINNSNEDYSIGLLDGIQNIMPFGVGSDLQMSTSNLVDAYKRSELQKESGLGIYALSAIIVDKAEPSEALKANVAWSLGLENPTYLLSSKQISAFRKTQHIYEETDIKGEKGAYILKSELFLPKKTSKSWKIIANVNQSQSQVVQLCETIINDKTLEQQIIEDIDLGQQNLIFLNASADGLQFTADKLMDSRHFANTLFNIMRGGVFDKNYQIAKSDFIQYFVNANTILFEKNQVFFKTLAEEFSYLDLLDLLKSVNDEDLVRLGTEYLPLKFSRRHGDPSRPWNKFSINTRNEIDGSKILDYQGNWRDIFQNWEALAYSFPAFIEGMIFKFLNASTFDGYNPYRVTKSGFDWETIEPDNPWSYIGYWGDHQIIYLLKFLEFIEKLHPDRLNAYFEKECFVYAAVPYAIKEYKDILKNPKDTVKYNYEWDKKIKIAKGQIGADGALLQEANGQIYHVSFIEKILATVLSKMSNFIPEAGIWMNTQRPEWNDANNALVGNGVSMVTLYYLRRFFTFFQKIVNNSKIEHLKISCETLEFYNTILESLIEFKPILDKTISNKNRKNILDALGQAGSDYRLKIYNVGFSGKKETITKESLQNFIAISLTFIDHSIKANERPDKLFHAYNLMSVNDDEIEISHLSEMLEGQVAVISSGCLTANETLQILNNLRTSKLYRPDQNSYILYPNKELPKFLEKNNISKESFEKSSLLTKLFADGNFSIVEKDIKGNYHFNGNFHNANDLKTAIIQLANIEKYQILVEKETEYLLQVFESVFNHKAFTGRSGTFYGYEGLGSIYWHMVSKLHLAVGEVIEKAYAKQEDNAINSALSEHYYKIGKGIGVHKTPAIYGAFPTDPYSHTPSHRGAQQPGMTGQVKEDILTRKGELGVKIENGELSFNPFLLNKNQFLQQNEVVEFIDIDNNPFSIALEKGSLAFTICQVPVLYKISNFNQIEIKYKGGRLEVLQSLSLSSALSQKIFYRIGEIVQVTVSFKTI
jgi:hypothetical protein